jgi:enoyl-CoA hydratase/carnithine racemase
MAGTERTGTGGGAPRLALDGFVATLTLDRPAHRNRLQQEDLHALLDAFCRIECDRAIRVLVLTAHTQGQPRPVFCAGYDIGGFREGEHDEGLFERVADTLATLRPLTVCALNGSVYGGACDLALACDFRIALAGTELRVPAAALGLHYYAHGLQRFVARLGLNAAKRALLAAKPFTAQRLLEMGLVEELAGSPAEFDERLRSFVGELCELAPLAAQAMKQSLDEIAHGRADTDAMRQRERAAAASRDFAEGRRAFAEKRTPRFSGE